MEHFLYEPSWYTFAEQNGLPLPSNTPPPPGQIQALHVDFSQYRPYQAMEDAKWQQSHSLSSIGYVAEMQTAILSDGTEISLRVLCPTMDRLSTKGFSPCPKLPVLFVLHGGGWVSGSHLSEEAWLLWALLKEIDLISISVEYRLAPEHKYPTWIDDAWEALQQVISVSRRVTAGLAATCDLSRLLLLGSSAGGTIAACLAQRCRDVSNASIPLAGVVLNVPILCHYQHFPNTTGISSSYQQCVETYMGSREMATCWDTAIDAARGASPDVSPLLGNLCNLPPHLIFVAGRDPLRDEGIEYASRLRAAGGLSTLHVYPGLPHNFAHFDELEVTQKFHDDLKKGIADLVGGDALTK